MRVLCITNYDDHTSGDGPTEILELSETDDPDEVFLVWYNRQAAGWGMKPITIDGLKNTSTHMHNWDVRNTRKLSET